MDRHKFADFLDIVTLVIRAAKFRLPTAEKEVQTS